MEFCFGESFKCSEDLNEEKEGFVSSSTLDLQEMLISVKSL